VTGSAPLAVFIYNTPFTMPYGSGSNGPATFFFATIVLTIFSIAYAEMAKKVRAAGRWQGVQLQAVGASAVALDPGLGELREAQRLHGRDVDGAHRGHDAE